MPLTYLEVNVIPTWSANCIILSTNVINQAVTFAIIDTKLYLPVVTLSTKDSSKLLPKLKPGELNGINIILN